MNGLSPPGRALLLGAGIAGTTFLLYRLINNHLYWNGKFVYAGKVSSLYIYPAKSFKGNKVDELECTVRGCKNANNRDRSLLVVDANLDHLFLTARVLLKMLLLEANVNADWVLTIRYARDEVRDAVVRVDLRDVVARNDVRRAKLHENAQTDGFDCGDEVSEFLTRILDPQCKRQLRLLYFEDRLYTERDFRSEDWYWNNPVPRLQDHIAYADLAAFMAFTTASVEDLNRRLVAAGESPVDERYFRPNIVVDGRVAFDEDKWLHVRIGETELVCYKPCTRCIMTTVDPDNGVKHPKMEPLKLLRTYRSAPCGKLLNKYGKSPIFGVNLALVVAGRIRVGDDVFVQYKSTPF